MSGGGAQRKEECPNMIGYDGHFTMAATSALFYTAFVYNLEDKVCRIRYQKLLFAVQHGKY